MMFDECYADFSSTYSEYPADQLDKYGTLHMVCPF